jgi:hypothetical protein
VTAEKLADPEVAARGLGVALRDPLAAEVQPESVYAARVIEFVAVVTALLEASSTRTTG